MEKKKLQDIRIEKCMTHSLHSVPKQFIHCHLGETINTQGIYVSRLNLIQNEIQILISSRTNLADVKTLLDDFKSNLL